jgi:hypothetical protein
MPSLSDGNLAELDAPRPKGFRLISRLLPPALRMWLHAQVEQVETLDFQIEGRDRDLLSGYIPQVLVTARQVVYQGFYLSAADLKAETIRINLGQVLRGKPLKLLAAFPVKAQIMLSEADLNASLVAPILQVGLSDFLDQLLAVRRTSPGLQELLSAIADPHSDQLRVERLILTLKPDLIVMQLYADPEPGPDSPCATIHARLVVQDGQNIQLSQPRGIASQPPHEAIPLPELDGFTVDLGSEIYIERLDLQAGQIEWQGIVTVMP